MSKTHVIDGKTYVEVERKAEVGEKVVVTANDYFKSRFIGAVAEVLHVYDDGSGVRALSRAENQKLPIGDEEYRVLELVTTEEWPPLTEESIELTANDIRWQPDKLIDLLANLARRVSSLEAQLKDTQGNVERQAEELENEKEYRTLLYRKVSDIKDQVASNESGIVMLDERTANHRQELNVIDHEKEMIFADIVSLSDRIRKLNGGATE